VTQATLSPLRWSKRSRMECALARLAALAVVAMVASALGCTASEESLRPPEDSLAFPTGMVVAPDQSVAFVTSANSELRYNSGSVVVLELDVVDQIAAEWIASRAVPDACYVDADHLETLVCDESIMIRTLAGVRVGNFGTDIAVQDLSGGALRLFVPTRGDPSIAWADWDGVRLSCSSGGEYALCDDEHRLTAIHGDADIGSLPQEPFGVFADSAGQFAMVTHISSDPNTGGAVTLIDSPRGGSAYIADVVIGVFQPDPNTGLRGATGVAGRTPNAPDDIVYVGSRSEDRIQTFTVGRPVNNAPPYLLPGSFFFLDTVGPPGNPPGVAASSDSRGVAFSPSGDRFYAVNRRPPSLQIFDT
jgi:hypothetical protein